MMDDGAREENDMMMTLKNEIHTEQGFCTTKAAKLLRQNSNLYSFSVTNPGNILLVTLDGTPAKPPVCTSQTINSERLEPTDWICTLLGVCKAFGARRDATARIMDSESE
jgi:hypothetical protein